MQYFWGLHPAQQHEFGYHHVRILLAELLVQGCGYNILAMTTKTSSNDHVVAGGSTDGPENASIALFVSWSRQQWFDYLDDLKTTVGLLFRQDSTTELGSTEDEDLADDTNVAKPDWVDNSLQPLCDMISMNAALAPIRPDLEAIVAGTATGIQSETALQDFV